MKGFPLVNPVSCAGVLSAGPTHGGAAEAVFILVMLVGCTAVAAAVDVVALPIQLPIRHGQWKDIEAIGASCALEDPVLKVSDRIASRMAEDVGFSLDPAKASSGAVVLKVETEKFTRSSRIRWTGKATLEEPDGKVLWAGACEVETTERNVESIRADCLAARWEVEALADGCAAGVVRDLQDALRASRQEGAVSDGPSPAERVPTSP